MEQQKVDSLMFALGKLVPQERVYELQQALIAAPDDKYGMLAAFAGKDPIVITVVSIFVGQLGIDRFLLGDVGLGVLKLLTFGVCGIMWFIDLFIVGKRAKEKNFAQIMQLLAGYGYSTTYSKS